MTFSQAQSRGRLLRFLVDNLGQEITSGSFAGAGSFLAVNPNDELVLANVDTAAIVNDVFLPIDASNAYSTSSINIGSDATPTNALDVVGTVGATAVVKGGTDGADDGGLYIGDGSPHLQFFQKSDCYQMQIAGTGYSTRKRIRLGRDDGNNLVQIIVSASIGVDASSDPYDPACPLEIRTGNNTGAECIRMRANDAAGDPYISWYSEGTRKGFIQWESAEPSMRIASEYGAIDFRTGTGGTELVRMHISDVGEVKVAQTSASAGAGKYSLRVGPGSEASGAVGYSHIGHVGYNGYAGFSHVDMASQGNYAFLQSSVGNTYINAASTKDIYFRNNNTTYMTMDSNGSFGIGTTTPLYVFEVSSDSNDSRVAISQYTSTAAESPALYFSRARGTEASPAVVSDGDLVGFINFSAHDGTIF